MPDEGKICMENIITVKVILKSEDSKLSGNSGAESVVKSIILSRGSSQNGGESSARWNPAC